MDYDLRMWTRVRTILIALVFIGCLVGAQILYKKQLGAIGFFLLSFFFMWLAYKMYSKAVKEEKDPCKK